MTVTGRNDIVRVPPRVASAAKTWGGWCGRRGVELWLPTALLAAWYIGTRNSTDLFFPPLGEIVTQLREDFISADAAQNLLPSLRRLVLGFALAVLMGTTVGYVVGLTKASRAMLLPVFDLFRSTPVIALIPVFIALFGIGSFSEVLLIAWAAFWPILLATVAGVAGVDPGFRDTATTLRMSRLQKVYLVRLPAAAPHAFAGINVGLSMSVIAMVAIELYSATSGLGSYLALSKVGFNMPAAYAGALAAGCVGYGAATIFYVLERRVFMKWHYERTERVDEF